MAKTKRNKLLTCWLSIMLIVDALSTLSYLFSAKHVQIYVPTMPLWALYLFGAFSIFSAVCVIALFKWRKWGFWGVIVLTLIGLPINLIYLPTNENMHAFITGAIGIIILYVLLNIGKENRAWNYLK